MSAEPACRDLSRIFDSTDPDVHKTAAAVCATCPVIDWCAGQLADAQRAAHSGGGPEGTWAGRLVGVPRVKRERRFADTIAPCGTEAAYQRHRRRGEARDAACKAAHTARVQAARGAA